MQKNQSSAPILPKTIGELLQWGTQYFLRHKEPAPRRAIEYLLESILHIPRDKLYRHLERTLNSKEYQALHRLIERYQQGEPLAYLTGFTDFYGLRLSVSNAVLIPRPETELLVDFTRYAANTFEEPSLRILDIGTGSGCLAIAIYHHLPQCTIMAVDISTEALSIAKQNAMEYHCTIDFELLDILQQLPSRFPFDIIVSNPPYVSVAEFGDLPRSVRCYEPSTALRGGDDGTLFYRRFAKIFPTILAPTGIFFGEISSTIAPLMSEIFQNWHFIILEDFQRYPRVIALSGSQQRLQAFRSALPAYYRLWNDNL